MRYSIVLTLLFSVIFLSGCADSKKKDPYSNYGNSYDNYGGAYGVNTNDIKFLDSAKSNEVTEAGFSNLALVNLENETVKLGDLIGKKSIVLVMLRGYTGPICPFCSTQTSRLISNYKKFKDRNAEVIIVYPIEKQEDSKEFGQFLLSSRQKAKDFPTEVPFPVFLDPELKTVDQLGIRKDLSKPATYILDAEGKIRFAYVGSTISDRPSIKSMLAQLDAINPKKVEEETKVEKEEPKPTPAPDKKIEEKKE